MTKGINIYTTQIDDKVIAALGLLNITPEVALKDFVKMNLLQKLAKYRDESQSFQKKYGMIFSSFQEQINKRKNEENFVEEDDYLDWKFSEERVEILHKQLEEIR